MRISDRFTSISTPARRPTPAARAEIKDTLQVSAAQHCPTGLGQHKGLAVQGRALAEQVAVDLGGGPSAAPVARQLNEFRQGLCPYLSQQSNCQPGSALDLLRQQLQDHKMDAVDFFQQVPSGQIGKVAIEGRPEVAQMVLVKTDDFSKSPLQIDSLGSLFGHENIFLNSGQPWKERREMMQPFFSGAEVMNEETHQHIVDTVSKHLDSWPCRGGPEDGQPLDVGARLRAMTLDAALQHMFGAKLSPDELDQAVELFAEAGATASDRMLGRNERPEPELDALADLILKRGVPDHNLLEALQGSAMDPQTLRQEVLTLALLGHETTANLLTWSLAELTRHPQELQAFQQEVRDVLGSGPPSLDQTRQLKWAPEVLRETARLHPPNYLLAREAQHDVTLDTKVGQVSFVAGTQVLLPLNVINATPDGNAWNPQRDSAKSFSFGGGSRVCLGQVFARMEANIVLAQLLNRFDLEPVSPALPAPVTTFSSGPGDNLYFLKEKSDRQSQSLK